MAFSPYIPSSVVNDRYTINQLRRLVDSESYLQAEDFGLRAIRKSPKNAELHYLMARIRSASGKLSHALDFAETAHRLDPKQAAYKLFLAHLYLDLNIFEMSHMLLSELEVTHPHSFETHWAMGMLKLKIGKGESAISYYDLAVKHCHDPLQIKRIKSDRAICLMQIGEVEKGRTEVEALRDDPDVGIIALKNLALFAKKTDVSVMMPQIEKILTDGKTSPKDSSSFELILGKLYELEGKHDEAFLHWTKSRKIADLLLGPNRHIVPTAKVQATYYSIPAYDAVRQYCNLTELPIFIGGMARSGTTLTEQIISAHSAAVGVGELDRMNLLNHGFMHEYKGYGYIQRLTENAKKGELQARANETLRMLAIIEGGGKPRIVEKTPTNWIAFGYIHMVFPNAKLIHCERHPADSFISSLQHLEGAHHHQVYNQKSYAEFYLLKQSYMKHWKQCFPDNIFEVKYEELVQNPETVVRALIKFVGLPWEDACLKFFENKSTVLTYSSAQVRNPIYTSSIGRWKKFEKHLGPLFEALKAANFEYPEA